MNELCRWWGSDHDVVGLLRMSLCHPFDRTPDIIMDACKLLIDIYGYGSIKCVLDPLLYSRSLYGFVNTKDQQILNNIIARLMM